MADRTVSVKITAVADNYFTAMRKVREETEKTALTAKQAAQAQLQAAEKQLRSMELLGRGAAVASLAFTGAFVAMVKASADFEQRMSQVQALSKATAGQMGQLRAAAFSAGKAFGLSATQVADAQIELTKAGVSVKDIIGGALPGALALAAAGQIDVAKATEIASNAMTEFKLRGKDVPHIADLLAAGADKSVASVDSLGDALNQSGLVAAQFGLSVEDTVGTLTAFSKAGLNGSDAGTSFKTMLTQLASPSKQAQALLDKYNIALYDSQGKFIGITGLADQLQKHLGTLSQAQRIAALSTIFGNDAIRASSVLYDLGGKKLQGYIDANNEAGFAALQASKKLDNLNGDVQKLGASFQNDLIKSGTGANDVLRGAAKTATGLLDVFDRLPAPVQGSAAVIAAVGAATTAAGAAFLLLTPRIAEAQLGMERLGITGKGLAVGLGKGAGAAGAVVSLASGLSQLGQYAQATQQDLTLAAQSAKTGFKGLDTQFKTDGATQWFTGVSDGASALKASFSGDFWENGGQLTKFFDGLTFGITHFSDAFKSNEGKFAAIGEQLGALAKTDYAGATAQFDRLVKKWGGGNEVAREALLAMPAYKASLIELAQAAGVTASDTNLLNIAQRKGAAGAKVASFEARAAADASFVQAGAARGLAYDIAKVYAAELKLAKTNQDLESTADAAADAVDQMRAALKQNGGTLDQHTSKGRANREATLQAVQAIQQHAAAINEDGQHSSEAAIYTDRHAVALVRTLHQFGVNKKAAEEYVGKLLGIPKNVTTEAQLKKDKAEAALADFRREVKGLNGLQLDIYANLRLGGVSARNAPGLAAQAAKNALHGSFAGGGAMPSIGPKGKDSFLIAAGAGEHMFSARTVDAAGGQGAMYAIDRAIRAGTLSGYAAGGAVGDTQREIDRDRRKVAAAQKAYARAPKKEREDRKRDLDDARQALKDAEAKLTTLRQGREDFVSEQRRGVSDPLSYVDQLRSMSRDSNFSAARRKSYDLAANKYEASLVKLAKRSDAAADKLNDLKQSADSMRAGITSAIAGGYQLSGASSVQLTGSSFLRDGISFQTTTTGPTADSIASYYSAGASASAAFAHDLKALAARGVNGQLLAELAGYGVDAGAPIAKALLSGTGGQIDSINASYGAIQANAAAAAGTVTDVNYKALIDSAQANADQITAQIAKDSEALRKLIARAFGLTGYAIGTMAATPGWHLVGEKGPELLNFAGGEQVANAARTRQMIAAAQSRTTGTTHVHVHVTGDDSVLASAMSVVADRRIAIDQHTDSVLGWGGAA